MSALNAYAWPAVAVLALYVLWRFFGTDHPSMNADEMHLARWSALARAERMRLEEPPPSPTARARMLGLPLPTATPALPAAPEEQE